MTTEYPLLVVEDLSEGIHFELALNDEFPEIHFIVKKFGNQLGVYPLDDVSQGLYYKIYRYAQKIFVEYHK